MIPFANIGPVPFFLRFVEIGIEVNDIGLEEAFPQFTGLEFFRSVATLEFEILLLANVSSDLR